MPHILAEMRAQAAVTSASKFKAKPEDAAEAEIPRWEELLWSLAPAKSWVEQGHEAFISQGDF